MSASLLLLVAAALPSAEAVPDSPAAAVSAALADVRALPQDRRGQARYLSGYHLGGAGRRATDRVLRFAANALSTEADLTRPAQVAPGLWRVCLDDYNWRRAVWEQLQEGEPYFNVRALLEEVRVVRRPWGYYQGGVWVTTSYREEKVVRRVEKTAAAPWLPAREVAALIEQTQSAVPIVRADWWLFQAFKQEGSKVGYYDFLGFKNEKEFQELGGVNLKASQKLKLELRAVIGRSAVTLNSREIEYHAALAGAYFRSNDFVRSTDDKNPLRLLDGDAKPDAHEEYVRLPNGLWAVGLFNAAGNRANTAPDNIASDGKARGTDRRVHVGISCFRCHEEGLRPVEDWARRIYEPPFSLDSPDYEKQKRLRALYLRDMRKVIDRQNESYGEVLRGLNGLTPAENAALLAERWDAYELADRDRADTAAELGVSEAEWTRKLRAAARAERKLDPVLAALAQGLPLRVEVWEEVYPAAQAIVGGGGR